MTLAEGTCWENSLGLPAAAAAALGDDNDLGGLCPVRETQEINNKETKDKEMRVCVCVCMCVRGEGVILCDGICVYIYTRGGVPCRGGR